MYLPSIKSKIILVLLVFSSALIILSIVLIVYLFPEIITKEIYKNVELSEGTEQYDRFLELPFPLSFKVYFFNVENPEDIVNGKKPVVKEVGPYIYKESRKKSINATDEEEDTISYTERKTFEFDYDASGNLSDTDFVTILNMPMLSTLQIAEKIGQSGTISGCLKQIFADFDTVFIKVKVKDILFDGIKFCIPHFSLCELRRSVVCKIIETKKNIDKLEDGSLKFSFFNYRARSDDGLYTVKRGIEDVQTIGQILRWNDLTHTDFWTRLGQNSSCDEVKGTDSTLYPPKISKDSVFQVYSTDICRHVDIEFFKEDTYKDIKGYMFKPKNLTFRSAMNNIQEDCFCAQQTQGLNGEDSCFLDGVIDMQPCTGAPVLISFAHFLGADKFYAESIDGMSPNEEIHRTFILLEPATGTPIQAMQRFQINTVLRPIKNIKQMKNVPRVVFPLLWVEEGISLSDKYIDELNEKYFNKVTIVDVVKWTLLAGSIILTIIFGGYIIYKQHSHKMLK